MCGGEEAFEGDAEGKVGRVRDVGLGGAFAVVKDAVVLISYGDCICMLFFKVLHTSLRERSKGKFCTSENCDLVIHVHGFACDTLPLLAWGAPDWSNSSL